MINRVIYTFCFILLFSVCLSAQQSRTYGSRNKFFITKESAKQTIGFGLTPLISAVNYDAVGNVIGVAGINSFLGWTSKHFYEPIEYNKFNTYWHWGTVVAILPYAGVGAEYILENGVYFGTNTFYILPTIYMGVYF